MLLFDLVGQSILDSSLMTKKDEIFLVDNPELACCGFVVDQEWNLDSNCMKKMGFWFDDFYLG